jgi:Transposase zinc-binding domain/Putative transposase
MSERRLEVADVFRRHESDFFGRWGAVLAPHQKKAFRAICNCRTAVLGGHVDQCDQCGHTAISYNSCRNRHCPKCQAMARAKWLADRETELLPVGYFHVVFTLSQIGGLAMQNAVEIYSILFRAVSETLLTIAADSKHLGAAIEFLAVLHTWGQNLHLHPHIHCVVPGGGISLDGARWISCRDSFFLPVRVLSRLFRKKFLVYLNEVVPPGQVEVPRRDGRPG